MHGAALVVRKIFAPAMPEMRVHNHHRARLAGDENLTLRLCTGLGRAAPPVRSRHHPQRPVVFREIVQHPHGIAHRVAVLIRQRAAVHVQRLRGLVVGTGRAHVQTAQLEVRTQHRLDAFQHFRRLDHLLEDPALIHRVGDPPRAGLILEFAAGLVAFLREELLHAFVETRDLIRRQKSRQNQKSLFFKLLSCRIAEHKFVPDRVAAACGRGRRHNRPWTHPR